MKLFTTVIVTLTLVGVSLSAREESESTEIENKSDNHASSDSTAKSSESLKNTGLDSSLGAKFDSLEEFKFLKSAEQSQLSSELAVEVSSISKNESSSSAERTTKDNTDAISPLTLETTPSPIEIIEREEEKMFENYFNSRESATESPSLSVSDDFSASYPSSESLPGTNGTSTPTESPIENISVLIMKSIIDHPELITAGTTNISVILDHTDFDKQRKEHEGELKNVEAEEVDKTKIVKDSAAKEEVAEHDSDGKKDDAANGSAAASESVGNKPPVKVESTENNSTKQESKEKNPVLKMKNIEKTEKSGENIDISMFSTEMENMEHVKITEGPTATKAAEENKSNVTPDPELEVSKTDNVKSTTASIDFSSANGTKSTDKPEGSKSTTVVTGKTEASSPKNKDLMVKIDDNVSTSTEIDVSSSVFHLTIPNKSSDNIGKIATTNPRKDQVKLLHVTTEPLTNHMTSQQNVVTEIVNNSGSVSTLAIKKYNYLVPKDKNVSCILASMAIEVKVPYTTVDNKNVTKIIEMPSSALVRGDCMDNSSSVTFVWTEPSVHNGENSIAFHISRDEKSFYVNEVHVQIYLDGNNFPHAFDSIMSGRSATDLRLFSASVKDGIHVCNSMTEVQCGMISVMIMDISLIAYNDKQDVSYRKEEYCTPTKNLQSATVIGCVVGVIVILAIIILLAWFKSRSNSFRSELP